MFKDKKFKLFIAFLALFICISQLKDTYAKYLEAKEGNTDFTIANWKIVVNDKDISEGSTMSSLITPVYVANQNIASGVIAPSSEGYFDLNLDYTNVDVSFKYEISIETAQESAVSDLVITGYSINGGDKITVSDFSTPLTDTISLSDAVRTRSMRIFIMWNDDPDTSSMNNIDDTSSTLQATNSAILNVKIALTQVV